MLYIYKKDGKREKKFSVLAINIMSRVKQKVVRIVKDK